MQQHQRAHRNAIGPLVKSQSLYLRSGNEGAQHWDFQSNINALIKCNNDEIMRVSLASVNVFNSYQQVNETNNTIAIVKAAGPGVVQYLAIAPGTYTLPGLAETLSNALAAVAPGVLVTYNANRNGFRIEFNEPYNLTLAGNMNLILGFSTSSLQAERVYTSDRASIPHGIAELVVELFGLTAVEGAAPVSNYESASDDVDYGHVLAVVPAGAVWERTVFYNNSPEFNSFFFSERSVNTLRIAIVDRQGRPHTWIAHPVGISLLFETFKRE